MVSIVKNYFKIDTPRTSYLFKVNPIGTLEHIYYGKRIPNLDSYSFLEEQQLLGGGAEEIVPTENGSYGLYNDCASFEFSNTNRGDCRELFCDVSISNDHECNFLFKNHEVINNFSIPGLPNSLNKEETLVISLEDKAKQLVIKLFYSTFKNSDVIVRSSSIQNLGKNVVRVDRLMSQQLDLIDENYILDTLNGAWASERHIHSSPLSIGTTLIDSKYGFTSAQTNPYIVLKKKTTTNDYGECYGFNLVYSGSHAAYIVRSPYKKVRVLSGINDRTCSWDLKPGEEFFTPEATICFSSEGTNKLTNNYHHFIKDNIVRGYWKNKDKPVLINNWEATYLDFNEDKLISIAKRASQLGVELFVLDDGWFGDRNDFASGLGDWTPNPRVLPNGLEKLVERMHKEAGIRFGLWVEPEMVNPNSNLFRAHPDWAIRHPDYTPLMHRNQFVLDLTRNEVVDYIIDVLRQLFKSADIEYVKWDCNRNIADYYSSYLTNQKEFLHRYMLGLYRIMDTITAEFPKILFESCSGGGNRVDMGILAYMPQFWCSDDTDAHERMMIQEGTLTCYPQCCIGAHVSASPNHQTKRESMIENRFNVACIGAFGYELDLATLSLVDTKAVRDQIRWYKENRHLLQYGDYYRVSSIFEDEHSQFIIVDENKSQAVYFLGNTIPEIYNKPLYIRPLGLNPEWNYHFENRLQYFPSLCAKQKKEGLDISPRADFTKEDIENVLPEVCETESYDVPGEALMNVGVRLTYEWVGGNGKRRYMGDFGTRIYKITKIQD